MTSYHTDIKPLTSLGPRAVSEGSYTASCTVNSILREALEEAQIYAESPLLRNCATSKPAVVKEEECSYGHLEFGGLLDSKPAALDESTAMHDVFSALLRSFGPTSTAQGSPFEPTPLQEDTLSNGSLEEDWEPFPLVL